MSERERLWPDRSGALSPVPWLAAAATAAALAACAAIAPALVHAARTDEYAGHTAFVPAYAAFLLWMDRDRLRAVPRRAEPLGALVSLLALALFAAGRSAESLTLQVLAVAAAMAGAVLCALGPHVLRAAAFPLGLLVLMSPLPRSFVAAVSEPIQEVAARFAAGALGLLGVPHHRSGIVIDLPRLRLVVMEGCNGLRFLMALLTLTAAFAHVTQRTTVAKVILIAAAVPVAVLANDVRVAVLALAGHYVGPQAAAGLTHHSIGKGVWALALVPLVLLGLFLRRRDRYSRAMPRRSINP
jgi:exosortase